MPFVCAGSFPVVSSVAAAVSDIGRDTVDYYLDCEHWPHIRPMALAHTWTSLGGASWLGDAAGIRMPRGRCRDYRFAPDPTVAHSTRLDGVDSVKRRGKS